MSERPSNLSGGIACHREMYTTVGCSDEDATATHETTALNEHTPHVTPLQRRGSTRQPPYDRMKAPHPETRSPRP